MDIKESMLTAIRAVPKVGIFAVAGHEESETLTSIGVNGIAKPINIPLTEDMAEQLVAVGQQAPFGKGMDTVVDTAVRQAWQYDPSVVTFDNAQEFNLMVRVITTIACNALGIDVKKTPVQAK